MTVDGIVNINFDNDPLWVGPEGWAFYGGSDQLPIPAKAPYSVIGKIGDNGTAFYVARFASFKVEASGELYLGLNDTNFSDNYGYCLAFVFHRSLFKTGTALNRSSYKPNEINLNQNYPNTFNPSTKIQFSIDKPNNVKLSIYNEVGERIKVLINKKLMPGVHEFYWNGKNNAGKRLSSGTYYYQLVVGNDMQSKKMILLK